MPSYEKESLLGTTLAKKRQNSSNFKNIALGYIFPPHSEDPSLEVVKKFKRNSFRDKTVFFIIQVSLNWLYFNWNYCNLIISVRDTSSSHLCLKISKDQCS